MLRLLWSTTLGLAMLSLPGCSPAARRPSDAAAPFVIPPLRRTAPAIDSRAVRFLDGALAPSGCFARSRRTGAVACLVGQYSLGSEEGERRLSLLSPSDEGVPDVLVRVQTGSEGVRLAPYSQRALDALMREDDFVALGPAEIVPPDSPRVFGGLTVELRFTGGDPPGEASATAGQSGDLKVVVRDARDAEAPPADGTDVLLENTLASVTCVDPRLAVRLLEPAVVLIERECLLQEGRSPEIVSGAWLCDGGRARCD